MRRQEISIADIARAAGVSHSTVSRALRGSTLISSDVRDRIQHLAQQMGYIPNAIAQSLQTQRTNTLGLVITSIDDPFLSDVVKGVEEVTRAAGFSVLLSTSHNNPDQEIAIIETFHRRRVDGILVASSRISSHHKDRLDSIQIPTILINSHAESHYQLHWVDVDDYKGAQLAVEHLLELGHRSIGYLGIDNRPKANRQRHEGYRDALAAGNVSYCDAWVAIASGTDASYEEDVTVGQNLAQHLLDSGVTAIFCFNDMLAIGMLLACRERGIAVPQQVSVVGFDDIKLAEYITPPLTTIHQPKVLLGSLATEMLLNLLDGRPVQNHVLSPVLKLRNSTAPL